VTATAEPAAVAVSSAELAAAAALPVRRSVLLRHLPTLVAFALAIAIVLLTPANLVTSPGALVLGIGIESAATLLALVIGRHRSGGQRWVDSDGLALTIPLLSLLAIGFFRLGTGGAASLFTSMMILPAVWIASEPGRRHIAIAAIGTAVALALPYLDLTEEIADENTAWRAVFVPIVYALAAVTVNELARRHRLQLMRIHASEQHLRAADLLTRSVLDAVTEQAVIGTDRTGLVEVWNPGAEAMLGVPASEAQGWRRIAEFVVPPDGAEPEDAVAEMLRDVGPGRPHVGESTWRRADGSTVPVEVSATPRLGEDGATVGFIFVAADMTRAHEASRVQDEFVGMISHELRTPVSSVLGHLELVRDDPLTPDQEESVTVAERNARRLLSLVNELLFTAQVAAGGLPVTIADVDLRDVVTSALDSARPAARRAGVELVAVLPPQVPHLRGDAGRLAQAVDNLVSNAVKFTPRGGSVIITVTEHGGDALVAVADTGAGIPAGEMDRLFGRFFRTTTSIRDAVPGAGLGLNISRAILTAHGGSISVQSEEGVGTTFTMRLPGEARR
jgi:PAS domain S-box-containing protein